MNDGTFDRRRFLQLLAAAGATSILPRTNFSLAATTQPARVSMARFPEKTELILLTDRPPQLETPLKYFRTDITPNEAFFVRWHVSGIPTRVYLRSFKLSVAGHVDRPLSLSVDELKNQFEPVSIVAVAQCSGNSRSFFQPRVLGGQWGNGAMGNAKWTGVRLRDLLKKAGMKAGAVDVSFGGLDVAPLPDTPRFVKSLDIQRAMADEIIVAYSMNDAPLPMLNGFPLRLVVPGWFATYWVKSLNEINVLSEKFTGFWMEKAYRIAKNPQGNESPTELAKETVPITRHTVRSLFVRPEMSERIAAGKESEIEGLAFDYGEGIKQVEVSADAGKTWHAATLGKDLGNYSWRRWRYRWTPAAAGKYQLQCRAINNRGEGQVTNLWNRSGYQRNVIEQLELNVT